MELVLVHITDIHLENTANFVYHWRYSIFGQRRAISICVNIYL